MKKMLNISMLFSFVFFTNALADDKRMDDEHNGLRAECTTPITTRIPTEPPALQKKPLLAPISKEGIASVARKLVFPPKKTQSD